MTKMQLQLTLSKLFKYFIEKQNNNPKAVMMELIELSWFCCFFLIFLFIYKSPCQINPF